MVDFEIGRPLPFSKMGGGRTFLKMCACRFLGYFLGVFTFQYTKSSKFSSLAPSALASHLFTPLAGGARKNKVREPVHLTLCSFCRSTPIQGAFMTDFWRVNAHGPPILLTCTFSARKTFFCLQKECPTMLMCNNHAPQRKILSWLKDEFDTWWMTVKNNSTWLIKRYKGS